jgi:hypothetical protein
MAESDQEGQPAGLNQPGSVITPGDNSNPTDAEQPKDEAMQATSEQLAETRIVQSNDGAGQLPPEDEITWTASEFIAHEKSGTWYLKLAGAAVLIAVAVLLLTKDKISAIVVLVGAFLFGVVAARQPRELQYRLDQAGVSIGQRYFPYEEFRSFSVVPEGAFSSIVFMPLKRFATTTTIYFAPDDEERIVQLLTDRLPLEEGRHDPLDRFMRRIRF